MRRRSLALGGLLAVAASVPVLATALTEPETVVRGFAPTRRAVAFRNVAVTTRETRFRKVPGFEVLVQGRGVATARFSGDFSGGPVDVRLLRRPRTVLQPGVAHFVPSGDAESFSYDFVDPRRRTGIECRRYLVSWRSPTGAEVTMNHATLTVDYRFDDTHRSGLRSACVD